MHGRFDLCIFPKQIFQTALVLECKHSKSVKDLIKDSSEGAQQIIDNKYEEEIINEEYLHVKGYGISFYKKEMQGLLSELFNLQSTYISVLQGL